MNYPSTRDTFAVLIALSMSLAHLGCATVEPNTGEADMVESHLLPDDVATEILLTELRASPLYEDFYRYMYVIAAHDYDFAGYNGFIGETPIGNHPVLFLVNRDHVLLGTVGLEQLMQEVGGGTAEGMLDPVLFAELFKKMYSHELGEVCTSSQGRRYAIPDDRFVPPGAEVRPDGVVYSFWFDNGPTHRNTVEWWQILVTRDGQIAELETELHDEFATRD